MKAIRRIFIPGLAFFSMVTLASAQGNVGRMNDNNVTATKRVIADIKPIYLFNENYLPADIVAPNSHIILGNKLRLDLQENKLYFLKDGQEMEVTDPVKMVLFRLPDDNNSIATFGKGYPAIGNQGENNFYQVLVSGKASLLMDTKFKESERLVLGSGTVNNTDKLLSYYGYSGYKMVLLNKMDNLTDLFSDKAKEIREFISHENIKIKKPADLEKVFEFYNGLFKK